MKKAKLFFEILDKKRQALLPKLEFLRKEYGFYLAGGTALALQIGHRTSADFDFYTEKEFDNQRLLVSSQERIEGLVVIQMPPNTLIVETPDEIEMSFFYYPYRLLKLPLRTQCVDIVSKEDIVAMKLIAIMQRGTMRDFIDLYFLMKEYPLGKVFRWTKQKFPPFNPYVGLRALTYFQDAEKDLRQRRFRLLINVDWGVVKKEILKKVYDFKKEELEK